MDECRQIENLIYTYAELIDNGDLIGVSKLFKNAEISAPAFSSNQVGSEEILKMYQSSCRIYDETKNPCTKHLTTNVIIEINEKRDSASARSYFTVIQAVKDFPLQPIISGRYHDSFKKSAKSWEFEKRIMHVDLMGDCSFHLL